MNDWIRDSGRGGSVLNRTGVPDDGMVGVRLPARLLALMLDQMASEISERCYCAGWMSGLEDALERYVPEAITSGRPQPYGQDEIAVDEAQTIMALVVSLGGWKAAWEIERMPRDTRMRLGHSDITVGPEHGPCCVDESKADHHRACVLCKSLWPCSSVKPDRSR